MYLAITLNRLDDFENACSAYEKAIELETYVNILTKLNWFYRDHIFELNYAITLFNRGDSAKSQAHFRKFEQLFQELDEETKNSDSDVLVTYSYSRF
jgi:Bardet-Biedl syndrome 4 protein